MAKPLPTVAAFVSLALLSSAFSTVAGTLQAAPAQAESSTGNSTAASNPFYVYLKAGESLYVDLSDPSQLNTVLDENGNAVTGAAGVYGPAQSDGVWQVDVGGVFENARRSQWNITARGADGGDISGRVWSEYYAMTQSGTLGTGNEDLRFWAVNDTGYIYEVGLADYNGVYSTIRADAIGNVVTQGECEPRYASMDSLYDGEGSWTAVPDCGGVYRIFFDQPADDLPEQANLAGETVYVKPAPLQPEDIAVDDFGFTQAQRGSLAGTFQWNMGERFNGNYWLEIDVDGDGEFDADVDRRIPLYSGEGRDAESGTISYDFDGLDGNGEPIQACRPLQSRIYFDRLGEIHFTQEDVEHRGSLSVTRLNGPGAPDSTLYWDDTQLSTEGRESVTPQLDGTGGVDSSGGVHGWERDDTLRNSWGNNRLIEDWTYYPAMQTSAETTIGTDGCLDIAKTSDAVAGSRAGDTVTYTVTATNTGEFDYTEEFPAVIMDDLSSVLDDGRYNGDAEASQDGAVSYQEPLVSWTGPLAAGESVELTYTVTLQAGGDRNVRNVAFVPDDPENPEVPECVENGVDPETGILCASTETELPALTIDKVADTTELPKDGGTVSYTVTVRNEGPGVTTAEKPATITDDLSEVLDDGDFVDDSLTASVGDASRNGDALSWSGPLGAGEEATITYQVEYDANKDGDHELLNVACLPVELAADPDDPCRRVSVPGAALQQWKTSDPGTGSSLDAGQEVTYTLHFSNTGKAAAAVDNSDDLSEVLDDAELIDGPIASNEALTVEQEGNTILVSGTVPAGEEYTVSYRVKVKSFSAQGDHRLTNGLAECDPANADRCETTHEVRSLDVAKTSDAEATQTGDTVTYRVTVTNTGEGDYTEDAPATMTDDLSDVIDDATFNGDAEASAGKVSYEEPMLHWSGPLAAGESVEIGYSVTVTNAGDHALLNTACVPAPGEDERCGTVETPLPHVVAKKASDPESGAAIAAGDVVTYTLTWTNDGNAVGNVDSTDDLSEVLDDADITSEPKADTEAVTAVRNGTELRVEGPIEPGQTVSVSYQVTAKDDGERGDNHLENVLVPDVPCGEECPTPVIHDLGEIDDWKTVDPASGSTVQAAQVVTYTLHFENIGEAPVEFGRDDVLTEVLDDAAVTSAPQASSDALSVSDIADGRFTVTGTLEPGQHETVSYQVTVGADGERGDDRLGNFLVKTGSDPDDECVPADGERPACTVNPIGDAPDVPVPPTKPEKSDLAVTGGPSAAIAVAAALALLGAGGALAFVSRRRKAAAGADRQNSQDITCDELM